MKKQAQKLPEKASYTSPALQTIEIVSPSQVICASVGYDSTTEEWGEIDLGLLM